MPDRCKTNSSSHGAAGAGAALSILLLAACAAPLPYQPRSAASQSFGYSEVKLDALHYSVAYVDNSPDQAEKFLRWRAAQLAQGAGFAYFVFDKQGANTFKQTENQFEPKQIDPSARSGGISNNVNDNIPYSLPIKVSMYFSAWGEIALLTADQARANPNAIQASAVLAQMNSGPPS